MNFCLPVDLTMLAIMVEEKTPFGNVTKSYRNQAPAVPLSRRQIAVTDVAGVREMADIRLLQ